MRTALLLSQKDNTGFCGSSSRKMRVPSNACSMVAPVVCANHSASVLLRVVARSFPIRHASGAPAMNMIAHIMGRAPPCDASQKIEISPSRHGLSESEPQYFIAFSMNIADVEEVVFYDEHKNVITLDDIRQLPFIPVSSGSGQVKRNPLQDAATAQQPNNRVSVAERGSAPLVTNNMLFEKLCHVATSMDETVLALKRIADNFGVGVFGCSTRKDATPITREDEHSSGDPQNEKYDASVSSPVAYMEGTPMSECSTARGTSVCGTPTIAKDDGATVETNGGRVKEGEKLRNKRQKKG